MRLCRYKVCILCSVPGLSRLCICSYSLTHTDAQTLYYYYYYWIRQAKNTRLPYFQHFWKHRCCRALSCIVVTQERNYEKIHCWGKKAQRKKSPGSSIRILLHFTYRLNEVICSHLNDSISVKHGASLVMENKWVPYPVKTALTTGRNLKWRQALVPLSLFSFATSACSHISIVEDGSV